VCSAVACVASFVFGVLQAEVTLLGTLRHPHLVRLLRWCAEGTKRLLVYEYMPNGSLDVLLHPCVSEGALGPFICRE